MFEKGIKRGRKVANKKAAKARKLHERDEVLSEQSGIKRGQKLPARKLLRRENYMRVTKCCQSRAALSQFPHQVFLILQARG